MQGVTKTTGTKLKNTNDIEHVTAMFMKQESLYYKGQLHD